MNERTESIAYAAQNEAVRKLSAAFEKGDRAGQEKAWKDVYSFVQPGLITVAERIVKRREVAEEIAQEALARAAERFAEFDPGKDFFSWLATIAQRLAIDHTRWSETKNRSTDQLAADTGFDPVDAHSSPEEVVGEQMEWRHVQNYLDQLTENQRKVMELTLKEGLMSPEIAERLRMTSGQVDLLRFRAKKKLRDLLESEGDQLAAK